MQNNALQTLSQLIDSLHRLGQDWEIKTLKIEENLKKKKIIIEFAAFLWVSVTLVWGKKKGLQIVIYIVKIDLSTELVFKSNSK